MALAANRAAARSAWIGLAVLALALLAGCDVNRREHEWLQPHSPSYGAVIDPVGGEYDVCPGVLSASAARSLVFFCIVGLGGMLAWSWLSTRGFRRQAASELAVDPVAPLRAGPYVLVGTVVVEDGESPVTIRIEQTGREAHGKGGWSHSWTETSRRIDVRPFVVRRDDGQTVKVEPGAQVVLHDTLSRFEHGQGATRTRVAEVKPGERIYVAGKLVDVGVQGGGGVYREAPRMPRLIPASTGPMVLSTEAPGGTARRLGRVHLWCAIAIGAVMAVQLGAVISPYWVQHLTGDTTVGTIQRVRIYETYHKDKHSPGYWTSHQEAEVRWDRDQVANFRIAEDLFVCVVRDGCDRVVVRTAQLAGIPTAQLGSQVTLAVPRALILVFFSIGTLIGWLIALVVARPWWLRRKVVDRGGGRLSMATTSVKDAVAPEPK